MRVNDPFGFVGAIQIPKDKKTVEKVHNLLADKYGVKLSYKKYQSTLRKLKRVGVKI
jgi:hypothetical protein